MTKGAVGEILQKGQQKKERQAATKRCQEIDKKGRENRRLYGVKILKHPPERR